MLKHCVDAVSAKAADITGQEAMFEVVIALQTLACLFEVTEPETLKGISRHCAITDAVLLWFYALFCNVSP